jgi:hypothetical protein
MSMKFALVLALGAFVIVVILAGVLVGLPGPKSAEAPLSERVTVKVPRADTTVESSFEVSGMAPGQWFFEGSFPVQLRDANNDLVVNTYATADGEWMTTELVPFHATVEAGNYAGPATLVLLRDNPSGLPENDDSVSVPIVVQ